MGNHIQEGKVPDSGEPSASQAPLAPGLYLVATPIGNLGDITLRALDVLRRVDRIACEDTRQTQKLLNHFQIPTPTESCHEHNERERTAALIEALKAGARIAVVTDAGMPGISDPGKLARLAPPSRPAFLSSPSPAPTRPSARSSPPACPQREFHFLGFLPEKAGARRTRIEALAAAGQRTPRTLVFYEAPAPHSRHARRPRIRLRTRSARSSWPANSPRSTRNSCAARSPRCARELASRDRIRGEITLLVAGPRRSRRANQTTAIHRESIADRVARLQTEAGIDEKEALKRLARELGQSKSELYRELQRQRARRTFR